MDAADPIEKSSSSCFRISVVLESLHFLAIGCAAEFTVKFRHFLEVSFFLVTVAFLLLVVTASTLWLIVGGGTVGR
jgi:hypothetical protein